MALIIGTAVEFDKLHYNGRYFAKSCDFGFSTSVQVPVLVEHDTFGYQFVNPALLMRASDGVLMLHNLDETLPDERDMLERVAAGPVFLSVGVQEPGKANARTLQLPGTFYDTPHPINRFPIAELSYVNTPAQTYLKPCQILLR